MAFSRTGLFSRGNGNPAPSMSANEKGKSTVIKRSEIPFSGLRFSIFLSGLWDLKNTLKSRQHRSKNILVGECIVIRVYGMCSLRVQYGLLVNVQSSLFQPTTMLVSTSPLL